MKRSAPAAIVALLVIAALGWTLPQGSRQPFLETAVWSVVVLIAFIGWGSLVAFVVARDERVDLGLRAAWGASAMAFLGGVLIVPSLMTRSMAFVLVEIGGTLAVLAALRERDALRRSLRLVTRSARREPRLAVLVGIVGALLAIHYFAGIAEWHTNPYDDDIAYLTFVKKLHDTGSFPEPFSFRRLSALGGQTFFVALTQLRAAPSQAHTFDRSICVLLFVLLVVGHRVRGRRPSFLIVVGVLLLVPMLPLIAINTAPHFSAIAFFLALFRTVVWADRRVEQPGPVWRTALPLALVGALVCTLRQNFLPLPAILLGASYLARIRQRDGAPLKEKLREPLLVGVFSMVALSPWFVGSWQSNGTFLYPLAGGTFNPALALQADSSTLVQEVRLLVWTTLEGVSLPTVGLFVVATLLLRESSPRRPVLSFFMASVAGLVMLVHTLSQGDATNLGRYVCGFLIALVVAASLTAGLERAASNRTPSRLDRPRIAAAFVLLGLLVQLVKSSESSYKFYNRALRNIDAALQEAPRSDITQKAARSIYASLQSKVPPGARMVVLLDEPHWLDFARNPIWNLDMPGYSSLPPGLPYFEGSEKVEEYLRALGVEYIAFVRPEYSSYHYRHDYWMQMIVDEMEIWRAFAPYVLDLTHNLVEIANRHPRPYDSEGMLVVELGNAR
jgi:hypothetical protein